MSYACQVPFAPLRMASGELLTAGDSSAADSGRGKFLLVSVPGRGLGESRWHCGMFASIVVRFRIRALREPNQRIGGLGGATCDSPKLHLGR